MSTTKAVIRPGDRPTAEMLGEILLHPALENGVFRSDYVQQEKDNLLDSIDIGGEYRVAEIRAPREWYGKSLVELNLRRRSNLNVLLIKTQGGKGRLVNPSAEYVIRADDVIVVMGLDQDVSEVSDEKQNHRQG